MAGRRTAQRLDRTAHEGEDGGVRYAIRLDRTVRARHAVKLPNGRLEAMHEHLWRICVTVGREELDGSGMVMDFGTLEQLVWQIVGPMTDRVLNEMDPFKGDRADYPSPTAECVARWIGTTLCGQLPSDVRLCEVRVVEAPGCTAIFRPEPGR